MAQGVDGTFGCARKKTAEEASMTISFDSFRLPAIPAEPLVDDIMENFFI